MTKRSLWVVAGRAASEATRDFFEPLTEVAGRLFGRKMPEIRSLGPDELKILLSTSAQRRTIRKLYARQLRATIRQRKARQSEHQHEHENKTAVRG